jgi:hypothetical protein
MWGKNYVFTIQAINRNQKMSLVSEPGIFTVNREAQTATEVGSGRGAPITDCMTVEATYSHIKLEWALVEDALDYRVYWDKGD